MMGTASPNFFDRLAIAFGRTTKAAPPPGALYPPRTGMQSGYLTFPGWEWLEKNTPSQGQDEQRARTAFQSVSVFANVQAIANEASAAELVVTQRGEDVDDHPLEVLWLAPNPHMGRSFVTKFWTTSYVMAGKAYLFWAPQGGDIAEVWPVPPWMVTPIPDAKDFITGYLFKSSPEAQPIKIDAQYLTYSHSVNLFDIRDGLSFLAATMTEIEGDIAASQWNRNFFKESNGVPDGLITVPKDILPQDLQRVRDEIRAFFGGTRRGVAVAPAGEMDYKPFGRTQKDAEFLEGRKFAANAIGRALGFPDGYWSESANRANAQQARETMVANAVWPLLVSLSEDINAQLIPRWYAGQDLRVAFKDIRPENRDLKLREAAAAKDVMTVNEIRERFWDLDPLDDARGSMLVAEIGKGMAIPSTPAAEQIDAAAPQEEAAPDAAGDAMAPEVAPTLPPAELPEDGADEATAAPEEAPPADVAAKVADLRRWERKARDKGRQAAFAPDALTPAEAEAVRQALAGEASLRDVFAAAKARLERDADALVDEAWAGAVAWAKKASDGN